MATITSTGLGSGLDIQNIVTSLVAAERKPTEARIQRQQEQIQAQLSAFGQLKSDLEEMDAALGKLKSPVFWRRHQTSSSNEAVVTATAGAVAREGQYQVTVNQTAQAHAVASSTFSSVDDVVGSGTLTIRFGAWSYDAGGNPTTFTADADSAAQSLTIDTTNNTLSGLRDAINDAGIGVRASIVNDGSGFRLVLTSERTGAGNALEVSVSDSDGNDTDAAGLSRLAFNASARNLTQTLAGRDAELEVDGIAVTSPTNLVTGVIDGVTLNLKSAAPGSAVTVGVSLDDEAITEAMQGFVDAYNQFRGHVAAATAFDKEQNVAAPLLGDSTVRAVNAQLRRLIGQVVPGLEEAGIRSLADVGLSTDKDTGQLSLDTSKFKAMLHDHPKEMQALFATRGDTSDAQIRYFGATPKTQAGTYAVEVTALATQGRFDGASVLPADFAATPLVIDADNDEFTIEVDGVRSGPIQLTQGSYASGDDLAREIQARINEDAALKAAARHVEVSYDSANTRFVLTSSTYGSSSQVSFVAVDNNSGSTLGFSVASGTAGTDVVGKINGVAAEGRGQFLVGAEGDASEGLQVKVLGGAVGERGNVTLIRGVADRLDDLLKQLTGSGGSLADKMEGLTSRLDKLSLEQQKLDDRMQRLEAMYLRRFNAMDALVAQFKSTGDFLTQQLKALEPKSDN
ncbi:flagellar hook-associated protein 2 [Methylomarinovum tepidoasis]|uniref:Flagellar hook-associated protein 2 n=1 Tax=Methylomarinovum tepidoasis TaxID=2840183 RepID=A0AAU9CI95_9GAMM|nr:flagellar filament capping protein FliD [Methylomarinovum sp. IN45]BCX89076.1 flagellar hook-associated protein 2 [Methylomarinovum sp. IN45]